MVVAEPVETFGRAQKKNHPAGFPPGGFGLPEAQTTVQELTACVVIVV